MKQVFVCFLFLCVCQLPLMAQNLSEAEITELMTEAFNHSNNRNFKEALDGFLKVGQNTKMQRTENEREVYVLSQTMAISCYQLLKEFEKAFRMAESLLNGNINESEKEELIHLYVINGYFVASEYGKQSVSRYADARGIFGKILPYADDDMRQRILSRIPKTWFFEGGAYYMTRQLNQALACMEKAYDGYREIGAIRDEVDIMVYIGDIKEDLYDIRGAMSAYQQASDLAASIQYDSKFMSVLSKQKKLSEQLDDNIMTLAISARMDSLVAATTDDEIRFDYYCCQGDEAKNQGNFSLAEKWYRKCEAYISQLDDDYIGAAKFHCYLKLIYLFTDAKKWNDALKYAMSYKDEQQRIHRLVGIDKTDYSPYSAFVDIYKKIGDSIRCFHNLDTLFLISDGLTEPRELRDLYVRRALCHSHFKNFKQALSDYKTADSLMATKYGENDGDRITLLLHMGTMEYQLGNYDASERLYWKYAERVKKLYGDNSTEYIEALGYLANAEGFAGHLTDACNNYTLAVNKLKHQIEDKLPYLTTAEREGYWKSVSKLMLQMTPFALEAKEYQTKFTRDCYDGLVLSKAFLLETERSTFKLVKDHGTAVDLDDYSVIASMQLKIREWEKNNSENSDSILELISKAKQLESQLASRCRSFGDVTKFMRIGYNEIKEKIGEGNLLIDFTDFVSKSNGRIYAAYLIDSKQDFPLLKKLFTESKIDSMQVLYPDMFYEEPYAEEMYQMLWMPFKEHVKEGATVYYVPSQLLFQIALESLPMEDGTLLGEHYHFVRLSSARELVNYEETLNMDLASNNANAVLYGGLLYDLEANDWEAEAKKYDVSSLLAVRGDVLRGDSVYRFLPGSKFEVDSIEKILKTHHLKVESYTGKQGTEESFLSMSGKSPQILHISTHGFFYTPKEAEDVDYLRGYKDAMSLSGLVMAGGNAGWLGKELPEGVLGGILSASNIARLDLGNTKMAVLAACKSGKGEATSEGLYGLQRAFKKAGVKTMIISLWNVSDVVGTEFMNLFYENLFDKDNHWNKWTAFNKAKLAIRDKYSDPFYWAGFVMLD